MTMHHPYRTSPSADATSSVPSCHHTCLRCEARSMLAQVPLRTVLVGGLAMAFMMVNIAAAVVTLATARLTQKMLATGTILDGASHAKPNKKAPAAAKEASAPKPPPHPAELHASMPPQNQSQHDYFPTSWHFDPASAPTPGILKVTPEEIIVDPTVVEEVLEQTGDRMGRPWITPERQNGKVVGVTIYGIAPASTLAMLGLVNGDTVETVNGFDITSPEQALEAYARLRTAKDLVVALKRDGQHRHLSYHIR